MRILAYILIFSSIIIFGSFLWTSDCLGVEDPFWFESFESFQSVGQTLDLYSDLSPSELDEFYFDATTTSWTSRVFITTSGAWSIEVLRGAENTNFVWNTGIPIYESYTPQGGGELFFDLYLSPELDSVTACFNLTYATSTPYGNNKCFSLEDFNVGWNSIEMEWMWDPFEDGKFRFGSFINENWEGMSEGETNQGEVTGFFANVSGSSSVPDYMIIDNIRMYLSIDIVDPEEEQPEEYIFLPWESYYASTSEKFATSTPLFNSLAGSLYPIINKMGDFTLFVTEYFNVNEATIQGADLGSAIPKARGYLVTIDDFIGLPLSLLVIFFLLTMAVVVVYKIILAMIKLLKP